MLRLFSPLLSSESSTQLRQLALAFCLNEFQPRCCGQNNFGKRIFESA